MPQSEVLFDVFAEERLEVLLVLLEVLLVLLEDLLVPFEVRFLLFDVLLEVLFDEPQPQSSHEQNFVHLSATACIVCAFFFMRILLKILLVYSEDESKINYPHLAGLRMPCHKWNFHRDIIMCKNIKNIKNIKKIILTDNKKL